MKKSLLYVSLISSLNLTACSTIMENLPGVYTMDITQGNIIDQDMIDQLRPNMNKRQVLYIMGSPMLVDIFHQRRWDYIYSEQIGGGPRMQKRMSLFFDGDQLIGVQGDYRPSTLPVVTKSKESTIDVPKRQLDKTLFEKIGSIFSDDDNDLKPESATESEIDNETSDISIEDAPTATEKDSTTDEQPLEYEKTQDSAEISINPIPESEIQTDEINPPTATINVEEEDEDIIVLDPEASPEE